MELLFSVELEDHVREVDVGTVCHVFLYDFSMQF